ncbi:cupin domain-containing protein [Streptomyces sp. NPDC051217]|uniref:cupin domain-containing protein n=1 Tax=Streptomyces sp. NPDC051217 TaxID=3365644 RepID=UPI00379561C6
MDIPVPDGDDPRWTRRGGIIVRRNEGVTKWMQGDTFTVKLTKEQSNGSLGFVQATVPPGSGPIAHAHGDEDEAFFVQSGELEILNGDETSLIGPGDFVFIPRNTRHRYRNIGLHHASMLVILTPAGHETGFIEIGEEPQPGVPVPPPFDPSRDDAFGSLPLEGLNEWFEQQNLTMLPE